MGRLTGPPLTKRDEEWIKAQHIFFVASAPLDQSYRVNVSPKSGKEFRVLDDTHVAWLDYSGSGSETAAHIMENGRLTIMFVAFTGDPKIMRLYGRGSVVLPEDVPNHPNKVLANAFKGYLLGDDNCDPGFRSIIVLEVQRITQSCGYSIPFFDFVKKRDVLKEFAENKGREGMVTYRGLKNSISIDGLRSIGQLEMKCAPSSFEHKDGYYMSSYSDGNIFQQLYVHVFLFYHSFRARQLARDIVMMCLGIVICILFGFTRPDTCVYNAM